MGTTHAFFAIASRDLTVHRHDTGGFVWAGRLTANKMGSQQAWRFFQREVAIGACSPCQLLSTPQQLRGALRTRQSLVIH